MLQATNRSLKKPIEYEDSVKARARFLLDCDGRQDSRLTAASSANKGEQDMRTTHSGGVLATLIGVVGSAAIAQPVLVDPSHAISAYATSLPGNQISAMTMNQSSGDIFYITPEELVVRVNAGGASTQILNSMSSTHFFAFQSSDIQYHNGKVFAVMRAGSQWRLLGLSSSTPGQILVETPMGLPTDIEAGLAVVDGDLYVSHGSVNPGRIRTFDEGTSTFAGVSFSVPAYASSMDYNPYRNRLYVATNSNNNPSTVGYHYVDMDTGIRTQIVPAGALGTAHLGNFAIDPLGEALYARSGNTIVKIDADTGAFSTFITGLDTSVRHGDPIFGPSSDGVGWSMYIGDQNTIWEVRGFIPSPSTATLVALAGIGLMGRRRRER